MKRALVLAVCLLMVGVGVSQAQKVSSDPTSKVAPATASPHFSDSRGACEGFEGSFPPTGWTLVSSNAYTWYQSSISPYDGVYQAECDYDPALAFQDEFLKFNASITAADNHLNFAMLGSVYWSHAPYANYDMYVTVNGTRIWNWTAFDGGVSWTWEIFDIDLSAYIGQTIEIGFEYAGSDGAQGSVDGVCVNGGYTPPPPPSNDLCAGAIQIPCGPFTISATTLAANDDYSPTVSGCTDYSQAAGPDVTYYIDMIAGDTFSVTMTTGGMWDDAIYLVSDCGNIDASCVAGADAYPDGSTFTYTVPAGGAGRYYLIVDGYGSTDYGDFTITGTAGCTPPPVPTETKSWGQLKSLYR